MATVTGYVERIKYRNEDNGYSVLSVADGGEEYILVGTFPYISEGERIEATGRMVEHSIYGEQLAVESYAQCGVGKHVDAFLCQLYIVRHSDVLAEQSGKLFITVDNYFTHFS